MSAFLGPIHHWLYGKIQLQEAIIARIAAEAEAQGWSTGDKPAADYVKEEIGESRTPVLSLLRQSLYPAKIVQV